MLTPREKSPLPENTFLVDVNVILNLENRCTPFETHTTGRHSSSLTASLA